MPKRFTPGAPEKGPVLERPEPTWLDGPRLVAWLCDHGLRYPETQLGPRLQRAFYRWKNGAAASVWTLDEVLLKLDLHLSEVPDNLWLDRGPHAEHLTAFGGWNKHPPALREAVEAEVDAGATQAATARKYGIGKRTVSNWMLARKHECDGV